jgi:hypothetical protein
MKNTLALSAAAIALLIAPVASAGVITLKVSATLTPAGFAGGTCTPTCTLSGDIVINNSPPDPGQFVSADITATGFSPSVGKFNTDLLIEDPGVAGETNLTLSDSAGNLLHLIISTLMEASVVGYTGGPLTTDSHILGPVAPVGGHYI